jgi:hypothetical protein
VIAQGEMVDLRNQLLKFSIRRASQLEALYRLISASANVRESVRYLSLVQAECARMEELTLIDSCEAIAACQRLARLKSRALALSNELACRVPQHQQHPAGILMHSDFRGRAHSTPSPSKTAMNTTCYSQDVENISPHSQLNSAAADRLATALRPALARLWWDFACGVSIASARRITIRRLNYLMKNQLKLKSVKEMYRRNTGDIEYTNPSIRFQQVHLSRPSMSSTRFMRGLHDLGFDGDSLLLISSIDTEQQGIVTYTRFASVVS